MSDEGPKIAEDFQVLVNDVQRNALTDEAERWREERAAAKALRQEQNPDAVTMTDLLGGKTREELLAEHEARLLSDDKAAEEAAAERTEDTDAREHQPFPPPDLTVK